MHPYNKYYYKRKRKGLKVTLILIGGIFAIILIAQIIKNLPEFSGANRQMKAAEEKIAKIAQHKDNLMRLSEYQKMIQETELLIKNSYNNVNLLMLLGKLYYLKANSENSEDLSMLSYNKSIYYYRQAAAFSKNDKLSAEAHFQLGKAYFQKGQYYYNESIIELTKARDMGYDEKPIQKLSAYIFFKKTEYQKAIDEYLKIIQVSKDVDNFFYLAYSYKENNDFDNAKKNFDYVIDYYKDKEAISDNDEFILSETYYALGCMDYDTAEYKNAESKLQSSLKYNPDNANAYLKLSDVYKKTKNMSQSYKMYQKAIKLEPSLAERRKK